MNKKTILYALFSTLLLLFLHSCSYYGKKDILKDGFINPPDSARPGVYWYFMDGNTDMKAMTADLESMKKAGIGYVLFLEVNVGVPRGKIDFLSDKWQESFKHAVRECERLGIKLILGSGPGWAGSGGPWVKPEESMMHLVAADTVITGPVVFNSLLPVPRPKKPFFGENNLTPELKKIRDGWYEDVRVLAFPTPAGSERIEDIDYKALYYRAPFTSQPGVAPFIPMFSSYNENSGSVIKKDKIIDLTNLLKPDGSIEWIVPPGKWTIIRMGTRNNGAVTRPAPMPGLGFEADKFDTTSFRSHYEAYVGQLIRKVVPVRSPSGGGWTMIHIDSWEMGAQNWSNNFIEQFIKRRGYDPMLFLPVYEGYIINSTIESERFLWDVRQTSSELVIENHAGYFKKLGRRNGFRLSIEPYDMNPASDFDLGAVADVPMCEFWSDGYGFNSSFSCIEATSISHLTGKPVVAAEAFTADHSEAWKKYPGEMKNQGDWALAMGINRIIFHTFAHKPLGDQYLPGMTMGPYGVHWDRGQTWWPMVSEYHKYLSRCQYILSQGNPTGDILYLTPEGAPQVFLPSRSALDGTDVLPDKKGYSFDGCSPKYLIAYASVVKSRITFPGGASYRILVLPDIPTMTPELLSKIDQLLKAGAYVIGYPPERSPSLSNYPASDETIRRLTEMIWGSSSKGYTENVSKKYLNGTIFTPLRPKTSETGKKSTDLYPEYELTAGIMKELGIREDFVSAGNIRYIHRTLADREVYFISNRTGKTIEDSCIFREGTMNAELWNPVTAEIKPVRSSMTGLRGARLMVRLDPWQSYFVIFYHSPRKENFRFADTTDFPVKKEVMLLNGPWKLDFSKKWGGPGEVVFDTLCDWSERTEEGIRYFSGTVPYSIDFSLPENIDIKEPNTIYLDLGKVMNMARVKLNGKDLGVIWTSPMEVKITKALKRQGNHLEIEVANLWVNRLIGDESKPWDGVENGKWPDWLVNGIPRTSGRFTFTTHHYYKKDDKLAPSGLIGPVRILTTGR
jgi:hypothetical protein